ncbi:MAG: methyltransferase domain-containing protein [Chloroflexi bacterium]|nr:methyltransferase domain-containing protein [Chloroflexota bacterium]
MTTEQSSKAEAVRLEELWRGDFGDAYVERNKAAGNVRAAFWNEILEEFPARRVLEVGCNMGANLGWIAQKLPPQQVYGIDINLKSLDLLHQNLPQVNGIWSPARELPFRDNWFDMVFTMGVLIHQPESTLPIVMAEIVRCSRRYVLCGEYYAEEKAEVPYRGQTGALFKRNYRRLYEELFPQLKLVKQGFLSQDQGWDDVTYFVFEKQ